MARAWNSVATRWLLAGEWRAHPGRMAIAVLAIAVGVALGFAVHLVNAAALDSFGRAVASVSGRADLVVRARTPAGFDERLYPRIARVTGVAAASPVVELSASWGRLARPGSKAQGGRFTLIGSDPLRAAHVTPGLAGIRPTGPGAGPGDAGGAFSPDALFLSPALARAAGVRPGGTLRVAAAGRQVALPVAGLLHAAGEEAQLAVIDIAEAQWRFGQLGRLQRLDVKLAEGADRAAVARAIAAELPPDALLAEPEAEASRADALSRAYRVNLGMLALVALLTGGFLVWSAQALSVARRRRQFALLSVLGLPRRGLAVQLLAEALLLGLAGAVLGVAAGYGLASLVVDRFGGDLGGGYFAGTRVQLAFPLPAALLFAALGVLTALAGSLVPALSAARAAPAPALKGMGDLPDPARRPRAWPGLALLGAGGLAALAPPVMGLPLLGYAGMALLLAGGVALMPALARALIAPLLGRVGAVVPALALRRLWASPQAASLALSGIVASTALMVAMAVMVASFRQSVDDWLVAVLPADLYLHLEAAEAGGLSPADQARLRAVPGVAAIRFQRVQPIRLDPALPAVMLMAQEGVAAVPLVAQAGRAAPDATVPVLISEPMAWTRGWQVGEVRELAIGGQQRRLFVAGVWRDYARQWGAVILPMADWQRFTGDASASEAAITLAPGADAGAVQQALADALPDAVQGQAQFGRPAEMRRVALAIFDRSFAVTYALEAIAILIGLAGVATSFSAQVLARLKEFGMLRHIGLARGRILAMLAAEGAGLGLVGALSGLALGLVMALVLVKVVNPQSFHWTMDLALPWPLLAGLVALLVLSAGLTALIAGRRAMGAQAVLAVRADW